MVVLGKFVKYFIKLARFIGSRVVKFIEILQFDLKAVELITLRYNSKDTLLYYTKGRSIINKVKIVRFNEGYLQYDFVELENFNGWCSKYHHTKCVNTTTNNAIRHYSFSQREAVISKGLSVNVKKVLHFD